MNENLERRYLDNRSQLTTRAREAEDSDGKRGGGYAALYSSESFDLGGFTEVLAPGAFARSLEAINAGETNAFLFWQHDSNTILASTRSGTLTLSEDETGLAFEFDTDGLTEQQAKTLKRGDLQVSFGFYVRSDAWAELPNGSYKRTINDLDLTEVSLVTYPAYGQTNVAMRSLDAFKAERSNVEETVAEEVVETVEEEVREDFTNQNELALRLRLANIG